MVQRAVLFVIGGTLLNVEMVCDFINDTAAIFIAVTIKVFQNVPLIFGKLLPCREDT